VRGRYGRNRLLALFSVLIRDPKKKGLKTKQAFERILSKVAGLMGLALVLRSFGEGGSEAALHGETVHFLLQTCAILDTRFREQFLSSNPIPFSFVQRTRVIR
jgi:hypothetical protein